MTVVHSMCQTYFHQKKMVDYYHYQMTHDYFATFSLSHVRDHMQDKLNLYIFDNDLGLLLMKSSGVHDIDCLCILPCASTIVSCLRSAV